MIFKGSNGRTYQTQERIAGGGEGDIYSLVGDIYHAIKIYKDPKPIHEEKIGVMVRSSLVDSDLVTWPQVMIYSEDGRFKGYLMNRIHGGVPISDVYQFGTKTKTKDMPWSHHIIIGINLCCALDEVHEAGHVIGDFNPNNMFINLKSGHVKLVDTDSYHIQEGNKTYRCTVSIANYLAPEITKKMKKGDTLSTVDLPTFTKETDNFALAIHLFQLLMNGAHPYQGALKQDAPSDIDLPKIRNNILSGTVPQINPNSEYMIAPSYSPPFQWLPTSIKILFQKAFIAGTENPKLRPDAKEWHKALSYYYHQLKPCMVDNLHTYYRGAPACPLCLAKNNYDKVLGRTLDSGGQSNTDSLGSSGIGYKRANYPNSRIIDDPYYIRPYISVSDIAKEIVETYAPIEERYLIKLCKKMLGISKLNEEKRRKIIIELRKNLITKKDGSFVTYLKGQNQYDSFKIYRVPNYNQDFLKIADVCFLDIRNAMLSVLKERGMVDKDSLINETSRRLGYARSGTKITRTIDEVIWLSVNNNLITTRGIYYRIV